MSPQQTEASITIDLSASEQNSHIEPNNLIQVESFKKLTTQIRERLSGKKFNEPYSPALGSSQVFFIDGTRGAGKSTFLSAVYRALCFGESPEIKELKLAPLQLLDPSKINIREHVFLSILYKIKKTVDAHYQKNSHYQTDSSNDKSEAFRRQFKQLAGGLQLLNEEHNPLNSIDEEVFLDWGIERAKDGVELAKNFQDLVELTCKILDANALVIAIDDADTNFKKGREILELIRCYLDTPRFIVLFTGDMKLYSHLVRDHYLENIGDRLHKQDPSRNIQREKLIDHLEDQYLLKLFPINKRIHLSPLSSFNKSIKNINITHPSWGSESRILDAVVTKIIKDGLRLKSDQDINLFCEFLYKQPLRSVLQLLNACAPYLAEPHSSITPTILSEAMRTMVLGSLYKKEVDIDALSAGDTPTLIDAVFRLTLEDGEFDTGAYLRPQPKDESLRKSFTALSAEVARLCEGSAVNTISYLLQGPGSVGLYKDSRHTIKTDDETAQIRFKNYLSIGREEDALNWAWHATPVIMGSTLSSTPIKCGVVRVNRSAASNSKSIEQVLTNLEQLKNEELPAFAYSLINVFDKDNRTYASIFNILGLMCRLLRNTTKTPSVHAAYELSKIRPTPTISAPRWSEGSTPEDFLYAEIDTDEVDDIQSKLIDNLGLWILDVRKHEKHIKPSAILIGKIWTRLYFSLINVAQTYATEANAETGPATIMEFYALCVINAVLIEEHEHHYSSTNKLETNSNFRKNPKYSGALINSKFKDFKRENYPLTAIIAGCPLILNLLPQTITYTELFSALGHSNIRNGLPERNFEYINQVSIPRQTRKYNKDQKQNSKT